MERSSLVPVFVLAGALFFVVLGARACAPVESPLAAPLRAAVRSVESSWPHVAAAPSLRDAGLLPPVDTEDGSVPEPIARELPSELVEALRTRYCAPLARLLCANRARCGCATERDACEEDLLAQCEGWIGCTWAYADPSVHGIDDAVLAQCLSESAARARTCEPVGRWDVAPEACMRIVVQRARLGEACDESAFCLGGGVCLEGRCVAGPQVGEPCDNGVRCATGLACHVGSCVAPGAVGAECAEPGTCREGLVCAAGHCRRPGGEGDPCLDKEGCSRALRCERGRCERATRCDLERGCGRGQRCEGEQILRCEAVEVWPLPQLGERCQWVCEPGLMCRNSECVRAPAIGERCEGPCAGGSLCLWREDGLRCRAVPLRSAGERCEPGESLCVEGTQCGYDEPSAGYRCLYLPSFEEPCDGRGCAPGLSCEPRIPNGQCVSTLCEAPDVWTCPEDCH